MSKTTYAVKIKARWATAADPDPGKRIFVRDGKSEGIWPIEPLPEGFWPNDDPPRVVDGYLYGFVKRGA